MKQTFSALKSLIIALFLTVGLSYAFATWTGPGSIPPVCETNPASPNYRLGCDVPINVGGIEQTRIGRLNLVDLFAGNLTVTTKLTIPIGAGANKVLTSDASGVATWQTPPTATVQPSGSWCGFGYAVTSGTLGQTALCLGVNPLSSCPAGYTQVKTYFYSYGEGAYTCIKN